MFPRTPSRLGAATLLALGLLGVTSVAQAHPHVFVTVEAVVMHQGGAFTGFEQKWTFDEFYSAMAVEGLDANKDGKLDRAELAELAKVNMEGLKEFGFFTYPTLAGEALKLAEPTDSWLEHKDGKLSLYFKLPLEKPVLTEAKGFAFSIYDPSYFIALDLAKGEPVKLAAGAPKPCKVRIGIPKQEAADAKRLGESFFSQLGGGDVGSGIAKTIAIGCDGK